MSYQEQTIGERCAELGLKGYDTALPQDWADAFCSITGLYPPGHFVWSYENPHSVFGQPVPLTAQAVDALIRSAMAPCTCGYCGCKERTLINPAKRCGYCLRRCPDSKEEAK